MYLQQFTTYKHLQEKAFFPALTSFIKVHPQASFFQSVAFMELIEKVANYEPVQMVALSEEGEVLGSLLGVIQSSGSGIMAYLSRRLIVWGGPLVNTPKPGLAEKIATQLISGIKKYAKGKAIYLEFRNLFATDDLKDIFQKCNLQFKPHLNFLVTTDEQAAVQKRMSKSRMRQIKSSLKLDAVIAEAENEKEVNDFYEILQVLYREKVKKPLPSLGLFIQLFKSKSAKIFVIKHEEKVIGGIACPIFENKIIYEWYVCGEDGVVKGLHPSILATWAPIQYALDHQMEHFDFMGAGKPDEDYGVRDFKARFGGEQVAFGRYEAIINKPIYSLAKLGLKLYQSLK